MNTASLFTRYANGLQAWPADRTKIGIPAFSESVSVKRNEQTGDSSIHIFAATGIQDDVALYIPRGGSVVIEAVDDPSWVNKALDRLKRLDRDLDDFRLAGER
jgi:hypothetical protein